MPKRELHWRKARESYGSGACVELAVDGELIALRNSRLPDVEIRYTRTEFAAFLDGAKRGEFDHLVTELP
jgi:Domain of unknown function (DUF397)